ncbi:MAG: hypothetical protein MUE33_00845 [Cytophagaceae bacterium]|jgi:hypothetical protein|nr:hypothetical protein [Cytophagaceae bacterium]
MAKIHLCCLFFLINSSCLLFGQTNVNEGIEYSGFKQKYDKNIFNINALGVFVGDYKLFYERLLIKHLSCVVGAGVTYENYLYKWNVIETKYDRTNLNFPSYQLGFSASAGFKFYFNSVELKDSYIGVLYNYLNYNYSFDQGYFGNINPPINAYERYRSVFLNYGYIWDITGWFCLEFATGLGITYKEVLDVNYSTYTYRYGYKVPNSEEIVVEYNEGISLLPRIGLQLGITF